MSEIQVSRWKCDICNRIYDGREESEKCIGDHNAEEVICNRETVTVGVPRSGQSMMGGPITFEGYDWTTGKIVGKRRGADGPEVLVEINGERKWYCGYILREWDRQEKEQEYRDTHPVDYSKITSSAVFTFRGR